MTQITKDAAKAWDVVKDLASKAAPLDDHGYCLLCYQDGSLGDLFHLFGCPWRAAIRLTQAEK